MEDQITVILQEEREEKVLRKAEMEATKAENMIKHKEEIFSRPKKTWFATEREKMLLAKAAKESLDQKSGSNEVLSSQQAEELKLKEKRKREREKNLPRKKRRRLEAAREMLENEDDNATEKKTESGKKGKTGKSLVDLGYQRAKAMKSVIKARESGKKVRNAGNKAKQPSQKNQTRREEMLELFQNDMSERKQSLTSKNLSGRKKPKSSFKSKSRYKRRK
ncbi:DEAD-box ATP-dependent RNA helicase 28 [Iris pallida]|uniref:DEAD-box ATP-dependent RNA helicase 28 n=1 Tax=Iris pallida TaxID=29817 RepID=A0AAX6EK57_IRIPA|nr:DEAD-box ATP-dependent RNA helicase 28 [Iris pallida]